MTVMDTRSIDTSSNERVPPNVETFSSGNSDSESNDKSQNICYKMLRIEQLGEKIHAIWNLLHRTRFFSIRNGCQRLLNTFMEYENSLYVNKI